MPDYGALDDAGIALVDDYIANGPHPSYQAFEKITGDAQYSRGIHSIWQFMQDSVDGTGGFADGSYLIPFRKESTGAGQVTPKLYERRMMTDYDQFAAAVCMTPWDVILQREDAITRSIKEGSRFATQAAQFWQNADRQRNGILEVMEFPHRQSRLFLTGWLVIDAPEQEAATEADESVLGHRPYMYGVRSQNVPHWHLDSEDEIDAIVIMEPSTDTKDAEHCPFRVWSRGGWSLFVRDRENFSLVSSGPNGIGVVPAIPLHDYKPVDDWFIGPTDMFSVSRLAQTVYNQDSEAREIERKAALFLAMGVKDAKNFDTKSVTIGLDSLMIFDGESGPPVWVSPEMKAHETLMASRERKKAAAYEVANMRAMVGAIETSSGFHALVEFSKSERAIAKRAKALETAERRATEIYLRYLGATSEQIAEAEIVISYPRKFGMQNVTEIQEQTAKLFETKPGRDVVEMQYRTLLQAMFPRQDAATIAEAAKKSAMSHMGISEGTGDGDAPVVVLNGAQTTGALEVAAQLSSNTISQVYAVELLAGLGIDSARSQRMASSIVASDRPSIDTIVAAVRDLGVPISREWFVQKFALQSTNNEADALVSKDGALDNLRRMIDAQDESVT